MKVVITDKLIIKHKGLVFILNLNDNNFKVEDNKYQILNSEIEVDGKFYTIKEVEKVHTAAPIEWEECRPIGIVVEELLSI